MRAEKAADVDVAMNCIDKRDLDELRRLAHPPADVRDVTDAILGLKGVPKQQWSWPVAQQMMKDLNSFKNDLKHLKTQIEDGVLPTKNVALVRPLLELDHIKDASIMLKKSRAASGLCETVVSLVAFHDLLVLLSAPVLPEKTVSFHDVEQATEAVNVAIQQLATANFNTIRSPPPAAVKVTMEAVCVLLGEKPDWPTACKLLAGAGFLHSLTHFDRDHIPIHRISALQSYLLDSNFQQDSVAKASKAAAAICSWVRAVHAYAR